MALPAQNPRFTAVPMEGEAILYDSESHNVIHLDQYGIMVWALCNGERDIDEIARLIGDAYPDQRDAVASDVRLTVAKLTEAGALSVTP